MILLLLAWHLTLIGLIAIIISLVVNSDVWWLIFGVGSLVLGLTMSILLRKTCSTYRSDAVEETKAPLDYY